MATQIASDAKIASAMSKLGMTAPLTNLDDSQILKAILVALGNVTGGGGGGSTAWGSITGKPATIDTLATGFGGVFSGSGLIQWNGTDYQLFSGVIPAFAGGTGIANGLSSTLTLPNAATTITGGGTLGLGGFTLTVPATGTAALLGTANVFTALQTITGVAGTSCLTLTGATQTASFPVFTATQTWNNAGVTFTGALLNITNTASATASLLMDLQLGGVSRFSVRRDGRLTISDPVSSNPILTSASGQNLTLSASSFSGLSIRQDNGWVGVGYNVVQFLTDSSNVGSGDLFMVRKAAATLQLGQDAAGVTNQMFTAANRTTSDGVGANLTIAGGNGRGGAGGSLILSYYTTAGAATIGTLTEAMRVNTLGQIVLTGLPAADPGVPGALYRTAGAVMVSL